MFNNKTMGFLRAKNIGGTAPESPHGYGPVTNRKPGKSSRAALTVRKHYATKLFVLLAIENTGLPDIYAKKPTENTAQQLTGLCGSGMV